MDSAGEKASDGQPLVSVVTPSLNHRAFIEQTIESVLMQDYPAIEYLVMDGGSTDGTLEVLRRFEDRLSWASGPDGGQSAAIAAGFERSRGEIIAWLNSDDVYTPGAVSRAVAAFRSRPDAGLVFGDAELTDVEGRSLGRAAHVASTEKRRLWRLGDCISQPAAFFRRSTYEEIGGLDPDLHYTMDYDLWLRLTEAAPALHVPHVLTRVRYYGSTKTATGGWRRLAEVEKIIRRGGGRRLPVYFELEKAALHGRDAARAAREGRLAAASRSAICALGQLLLPRVVWVLMLPATWRLIAQNRRHTRASKRSRPPISQA